MNKQKVFAVIAAIIMLIGIIVAYTCELGTTTILEYGSDVVSANIGMHVFVIMLFVAVSTVFLLLAYKDSVNNAILSENPYAFFGAYALSGLFFSLASGYQVRATNLQDFYIDMKAAPGWYSSEFTSTDWFNNLPETADQFSSSATLWYVLMVGAIVLTIVLGTRIVKAINE